MSRIPTPECPKCLRRHPDLMTATQAAFHAHVRFERFQAAVAAGSGPPQWAHGEMYDHPRYHVENVDAWTRATRAAA